jgi:hypothetical protein
MERMEMINFYTPLLFDMQPFILCALTQGYSMPKQAIYYRFFFFNFVDLKLQGKKKN